MSRIRILAGLSALLNLTILIAVALAVFTRFPTVEGDIGRFQNGAKTFRYFTTDSNLLAALASLIILPFSLRTFFGVTEGLPLWVQTVKYIAVCSVTLTFLTVVCFLAPTQGWGRMFSGANLWLHLICPLLCILSYLFLESRNRLPFSATFAALIPIVLYGAVYLIAVVFVGESGGGWKDFYGFNRGGMWFVALPLLLGVSYLIALGQRALSILIQGKLS